MHPDLYEKLLIRPADALTHDSWTHLTHKTSVLITE